MWRDHAACRDKDPELFFPLLPSDDVWAAKVICSGCPVAAQCLNEALRIGDNWAIRAGTTPAERRPRKSADLPTQDDLGLQQQLCEFCSEQRRRGGYVRWCSPECHRAATCGTEAGYAAHKRRGEASCRRCLTAAAATRRRRKAATA